MRIVLTLLSLSSLPVLLVAQAKTGTFVPFGSACVASGGTTCASANPNGGTVNQQTLTNEYAYPFSLRSTSIVTGYQFFTRSQSGVKTVPTSLYKATAAGAPEAGPIATGRMIVGPSDRFYRSNLAKPLLLKAGNYFLAFWCVENPHSSPFKVAAVNATNLTSGTQVTGIYWRRANPTWALTTIITTPSFKLICAGALAPTLTSTNVPEIGKPFTMFMKGKSSTLAVHILGASKTKWAALSLPLDLNAIASGCWLQVSTDLFTAKVTDTKGVASLILPIPNQKSLIGLSLHHQFIISDSRANTLGWLFSHGVTTMIGGIK